MRKTGRCILSAVIAVLLMIGAIDYAFVIGKAKPVGDLKTSQSEVIVKDFIHDNYEISEKNPWTDYGLHPIEYTESAGKSGFDQAISAKAAILVNVNSKEIYYEKNVDVYDYVKKNAKNIRYSSVIKQFSKYNLVYEVSGDWMLPDFKPGDMLALVEVPENAPIMNGSPYVIDTMSTGLIFRLIYQQEDGLLCRSFNDDRFAPFSIARDDIYNIYRVIGMLRTNV